MSTEPENVYPSDHPQTRVGWVIEGDAKFYVGYAKLIDGGWQEQLRSRNLNTIINFYVSVALNSNLPNAPVLHILQYRIQEDILDQLFSVKRKEVESIAIDEANTLEDLLYYQSAEEKQDATKSPDKKATLKPTIIIKP